MDLPNVQTSVDATLALLLGLLLRHFQANRKSGRARDATVAGTGDKVEASLKASDERNAGTLREFGSQVLALNQTAWQHQARVDVLEVKVDNIRRELERLRDGR